LLSIDRISLIDSLVFISEQLNNLIRLGSTSSTNHGTCMPIIDNLLLNNLYLLERGWLLLLLGGARSVIFLGQCFKLWHEVLFNTNRSLYLLIQYFLILSVLRGSTKFIIKVCRLTYHPKGRSTAAATTTLIWLSVKFTERISVRKWWCHLCVVRGIGRRTKWITQVKWLLRQRSLLVVRLRTWLLSCSRSKHQQVILNNWLRISLSTLLPCLVLLIYIRIFLLVWLVILVVIYWGSCKTA